jgi:aldehyde dehydrogenase (NAD+)
VSEVKSTVARLRTTFESGRTKSYEWRAAQLDALALLLQENEEALIGGVIADHRRDRGETWIADYYMVLADVEFARAQLESWMKPEPAGVPDVLQPGEAWTQYEPLGLTLIIAPWNYPVQLALVPLIGAIAAGDCAVIKPSEVAPHTSKVLAELLPKYLDTDAFAVIEGDAAMTKELLDQGFDHCFFTGSPAIGREVMLMAAEHLTPVVLELGGKSPVIVTKNANLEATAQSVAWGKVMSSGQTCVAPDYILVEESVRDELVAQLSAALPALATAPMLPIINARHLARITSLLDEVRDHIVLGGEADTDEIRLQPTIVVDPPASAKILSEEIFGPVLPVLTVKSLDEAIAHVKRGTKPLAAYLFTSSPDEEATMLAQLSAGGVMVNGVMQHLGAPELPFGGVGTSGMGNYHGKYSFEAFSHKKAVLRKPATA